MQPLLEKIENNFGSAFSVRSYQGNHICRMPFWHIHPEYELVYIKNGHGKRHVGKSVSTYTNGDLILLGPNVPHSCFSNQTYDDNVEVVIQFNHDFAGPEFWKVPEMGQIGQLLKRSSHGISFGESLRNKVGEEIITLNHYVGFDRFVRFIKILNDLALTKDFTLLGASTSSLVVKSTDYNRITKVYSFIEANFQNTITPEEVARHVSMTLPAFCRFFKRTTEKTFTTFLNEFRVSHSCQLIMEGMKTLSEVSEACGFQSASYFNKQFKRIVGTTPTQYKTNFIKVLAS
ncbi:MAG: AraC family transcriptional regulator [Bacteroidota bacterium]